MCHSSDTADYSKSSPLIGLMIIAFCFQIKTHRSFPPQPPCLYRKPPSCESISRAWTHQALQVLDRNHKCLFHIMSSVTLKPLIYFVWQTIHHFYLPPLPTGKELEYIFKSIKQNVYSPLCTSLHCPQLLTSKKCSFREHLGGSIG